MPGMANPYDSARFKRIEDFQKTLSAGSGVSLIPDVRGQRFDEDLKSGAFSQTGLHEVASSLMDNIRRLGAQARLPMSFFNYGRIFQEAYVRICEKHGKSPDAPLVSPGYSPEEMKLAADIEMDLRKWILESTDHSTEIGWATDHFDVAGIAAFELPQIQIDVENLGGLLLIQAWTIFESLSEDLWAAALNWHPTKLAAFSGQSAVAFDELQRNQFNVRSKMGTILKNSSKVSFRSLVAIQEAYALAFTEQSQSIHEILNDPGLRYAAAVRNVLIHKRGKVDAEFFKQIVGIAGVPKLEHNDKFPLTGDISAKLADSCRGCAAWLVNAVHAWLLGHPEKMPPGADDVK